MKATGLFSTLAVVALFGLMGCSQTGCDGETDICDDSYVEQQIESDHQDEVDREREYEVDLEEDSRREERSQAEDWYLEQMQAPEAFRHGSIAGASDFCPPEFPVKGDVPVHEDVLTYYEPGTPGYDDIRPELCFASAGAARDGHFTPAS